MANCILKCNKTMEESRIKAIEEKIQKLYKELQAEINKYVEAGGTDLYKTSLTCTREEKNKNYETIKIPDIDDTMTIFDFTDSSGCKFYADDKVKNININFNDAFSTFDDLFDSPFDWINKKTKKDSLDSAISSLRYINKRKSR